MKTRRGVLFVLSSLVMGGSETKVIRIANSLAGKGVDVQIAFLGPPETNRFRINPTIEVIDLRRRGKFSVRALCRLNETVSFEDQTIVAVNLYPLLYVIPIVKWRASLRLRAIGLVNTAELVGRDRLFENLYSPLLKRCDQVIFGCRKQQEKWVKKYALSEERSRVVYNGVDSCFFSPIVVENQLATLRQQYGIPEHAVVIGTVGRLDPEKSFDVLVVALAKLNATGYLTYGIIVGDGGERQKLKQLAHECGIGEKVRFVGIMQDVRPLMALFDIFVLPSSAVETFSNAALEAMAMSRPVVLSDMGGAEEMVETGKSGMVFPVGNMDKLMQILVMLHSSADIRKCMGDAARQRVLQLFTFEAMVDEYNKLIGADRFIQEDLQ